MSDEMYLLPQLTYYLLLITGSLSLITYH